jgi:hypothetical protein
LRIEKFVRVADRTVEAEMTDRDRTTKAMIIVLIIFGLITMVAVFARQKITSWIPYAAIGGSPTSELAAVVWWVQVCGAGALAADTPVRH